MNERRKSIAYLGHGLHFGGATTSLYLMLKSLGGSDYCKYLYVTSCESEEMKNDFLKYCEEVSITSVPHIYNDQVQTTPLSELRRKQTAACSDLVEIIKRNNIDILHINSSVLSVAHRRIKENTGAKIVTHVREMITKYGRGEVYAFMVEQIYKYSDAIITISDNEAKPFRGHPNLKVIANPFDFTKTENISSDFRKENNISEETVLVGMMGQFHKGKGHLDYLKALKIIVDEKKAKSPFIFIIMGVYPEDPFWKRLAKTILLKGNYRKTVLNYIKTNDLGQFVRSTPYTYHFFKTLKAVDIMVRPSLAGDPWGRDIIESMAFKKPIVATGQSEFFVQNGKTGYLVPQGAPSALAEKILELINDAGKRKKFGENGHNRAREMCEIRKYGEKIDNIYKELTQEKKNDR